MTFGDLSYRNDAAPCSPYARADINFPEQNSTFFITLPAARLERLTFMRKIRPNPYISSKSTRKFISKKVHFLLFGGLTKVGQTPIISSLPRKLERGF
jgi:hypothetical protein